MLHSVNKTGVRNSTSVSQFNRLVSKVGDIFRSRQHTSFVQKNVRRTADSIDGNGRNELEVDLSSRIAQNIENALKEAKRDTLGSCRLLIPCELSLQIAEDILGMSESEPCGLRGCLLYIHYEDKEKSCRMAQLKFGDRTIVPTFEMYLYLKRNNSSWFNLVPSRLLTRFGQDTVVISDGYKLSKKKLFRSLSAP
ncbi:DNA damage-inducible transcript 4-like protein [Leptotrombidium deliense]|uniref:DNA damage-inducible transcript 4-like protein n=1 Tax=Leptotrombidium deliense TaxID=299467 RepID=A0A443SPV0_9ACAR|nr:DNA damage-inducible transcript 4-like protein [Leptotrombidium deliense]